MNKEAGDEQGPPDKFSIFYDSLTIWDHIPPNMMEFCENKAKLILMIEE